MVRKVSPVTCRLKIGIVFSYLAGDIEGIQEDVQIDIGRVCGFDEDVRNQAPCNGLGFICSCFIVHSFLEDRCEIGQVVAFAVVDQVCAKVSELGC